MKRSAPSVGELVAYANKPGVDAPKILAAKNTSAADDLTQPEKTQRRTAGLRLFDIVLYPIFTNIAVFAISVAATYLTTKGNDHGKIGAFFQKRGDWLVKKFKGMGMTHGQADMSKMVFFSFVDGSIMAPFIKLLEDRREKIGQWFDDKLGTKPVDNGAYEAEPKHSWLSVLGGRFTTAAIVVPTAVAMDKAKVADTLNPGQKINLNEKFFNRPGARLGEWMSKQPGIAKWFGKLDAKEIMRIAAFEIFYTTVCTAGLYFTSRRIARYTHRNDPPKQKPDMPVIIENAGAQSIPAASARSFADTIAAERLQAQNTQPALVAH